MNYMKLISLLESDDFSESSFEACEGELSLENENDILTDDFLTSRWSDQITFILTGVKKEFKKSDIERGVNLDNYDLFSNFNVYRTIPDFESKGEMISRILTDWSLSHLPTHGIRTLEFVFLLSWLYIIKRQREMDLLWDRKHFIRIDIVPIPLFVCPFNLIIEKYSSALYAFAEELFYVYHVHGKITTPDLVHAGLKIFDFKVAEYNTHPKIRFFRTFKKDSNICSVNGGYINLERD